MKELFDGYKLQNGKRYDWISQLKYKTIEASIRKNSKRLLQQGVPQFFIVSQDHISNRIVLNGIYERGLLDEVISLLSRNDKFIGSAVDAGANIGNHSLYLSRFFENVFSFEPNPKLDLILRANAALVKNIKCFCLGLSNTSTAGELNIVNSFNLGMSTVKTSAQSELSHPIELIKLDDVPEISQSHIGLLKIDVENWEVEVLEGSQNTINRCKPIILFEQHAVGFESDGNNSGITSFLRKRGYDYYYEVDIFPRIERNLPTHIKNIIEHFMRILSGYKFEVRRIHKFKRKFYSIVIASTTELDLSY